MQPARFWQADFLLVEINNAKSTSPAMSSGEECGLLSWTAAGNQAYKNAWLSEINCLKETNHSLHYLYILLMKNVS